MNNYLTPISVLEHLVKHTFEKLNTSPNSQMILLARDNNMAGREQPTHKLSKLWGLQNAEKMVFSILYYGIKSFSNLVKSA